MVEVPQAIIDRDGTVASSAMLDAADGRLTGDRLRHVRLHGGRRNHRGASAAPSSGVRFREARDAGRRSPAPGFGSPMGRRRVLPVPIHDGRERRSAEQQRAENARRFTPVGCCISPTSVTRSPADSTRAGICTRHSWCRATRRSSSFYLEGIERRAPVSRRFSTKRQRRRSSAACSTSRRRARDCSASFCAACSAGAITEAEAIALTGLSADELRERSIVSILRRRGVRPTANRIADERSGLRAARLRSRDGCTSIAGIMWIGNSLLFNWLDRSLVRRHAPSAAERAARHDLAAAQRRILLRREDTARGEPLPRPLHWFKWQAYTTWLTGVALLLVVYYCERSRGSRRSVGRAAQPSRGGRRRARRDRRRMGALRIDAARRRAARPGDRGDRSGSSGFVAIAIASDAASVGTRGVSARRRDARDDHGGQRLR